MSNRTTAIAVGSVAVVAAAATITVAALLKDDGQPLPKPTVGAAASYRLDVPKGGGDDGGLFPRDGARVALTPDGGAVFQTGAASSVDRVFRLSSGGSLSELSGGDASKMRPAVAGPKVLLAADGSGITEFDPASGSISSIPASGLPLNGGFPVGAEPDGTILVADYSHEVVWAVNGGAAEQFAAVPVTGLSQHCPSNVDGSNCTRFEFQNVVVDGKGVVYALEKYSGARGTSQAEHFAPLSTLLAISGPGATPTPVALPASVAGVQSDPHTLRTLAVTAADDGVYALVEPQDTDATGDTRYILHVHTGSVEVVASQAAPARGSVPQCSFKGTVRPTELPCLPDDDTASLAYRDGRLLVAGWLDYPNDNPASQTANVVIGVPRQSS